MNENFPRENLFMVYSYIKGEDHGMCKLNFTCKATKFMIFLTPKEQDLDEQPMWNFVESSHALHLVGIA